jgi:hypothetical protein
VRVRDNRQSQEAASSCVSSDDFAKLSSWEQIIQRLLMEAKMKKIITLLFLAGTVLAMIPKEAAAVVCARGVYGAGCVGPRGAVVARRGVYRGGVYAGRAVYRGGAVYGRGGVYRGRGVYARGAVYRGGRGVRARGAVYRGGGVRRGRAVARRR